ncbi:hypothetical protein [Undibacterium sp. Ji49W]|uniref:hypothetical protein n=1 Tax=Undibacterium sp. Ji49W TaxID=3413040 RepID=UPI003BF02F13
MTVSFCVETVSAMIYILGEDNWKRDIAVGIGMTCNPLPERFGYHHPNDDGQSVF